MPARAGPRRGDRAARLLASKGIPLDVEQTTETKTALEFFSAELREAAAPPPAAPVGRRRSTAGQLKWDTPLPSPTQVQVRYLLDEEVEGGATRTVVAATKLSIPRSRRPLVARPALSAELDGDYRIALVSAPAGYGKTATLASWASTQPGKVAWLSCDALDAEPTRFMSCLLTTVSATWPGVADDAFVLLDRDGANTYDAALSMANELANVDGPGIIVVDDLHLAAPAPTVLAAFIDALPDGFRFVAGTRADPPLSLARLRLHGELLELRADDLGFEAKELSAFFALQDVALDDGDLVRMHDLTEGWPAGVQMAAIALQRGAERSDFLEAFATTDRAVSDFLLSEVLASLPPELVEFLIETSVLEMFDAELCAAMTGVDDAARVLDRLLAANLFLVPLDDPVRWFRYHHLFGAFLRARLASLGRGRVRAAHARASEVLEARGDVSASLRHAMAIGDADRAGRILRTSISSSMGMPDVAEDAMRAVRLWLHEQGEACVESDPVWVLELLIGLMGLARPQDAVMWIERIQRAHPEADGPLTALIEGTWNEHHQTHGQPIEALRHLDRAGDAVGWRPPPDSGLLALLVGDEGPGPHPGRRARAGRGGARRGPQPPRRERTGRRGPQPGCRGLRRRGAGRSAPGGATCRGRPPRRPTGSGSGGHELGRVYAGPRRSSSSTSSATSWSRRPQRPSPHGPPSMPTVASTCRAWQCSRRRNWRVRSETRPSRVHCSCRRACGSTSPTRPSVACSPRRPSLMPCASIRQRGCAHRGARAGSDHHRGAARPARPPRRRRPCRRRASSTSSRRRRRDEPGSNETSCGP